MCVDRLTLLSSSCDEKEAHDCECRFVVQCVIGQVPKWPKGADCKSVAIGFQGSNPCLPTISGLWGAGVCSLIEDGFWQRAVEIKSAGSKRAGVAQW